MHFYSVFKLKEWWGSVVVVVCVLLFVLFLAFLLFLKVSIYVSVCVGSSFRKENSIIGDGGYFFISGYEISYYEDIYSGTSQKGWWLF